MRRPAAPLVTLALVAAIVAVFALELVGDGLGLCYRFGLVPAHPSIGAALTSMFLHDPSGLAHIGGNLAVLLVVGTLVERAIGSWRFAAVFFAGGLGGAALHLVVDPSATAPLVGVSGAIFGVLAVAAVLRPGLLGFVLVFAGFEIWRAFVGDDGAASFGAHLGGLAAGTVVAVLARMRGVELRPRARRAAFFAPV